LARRDKFSAAQAAEKNPARSRKVDKHVTVRMPAFPAGIFSGGVPCLSAERRCLPFPVAPV
jgi:hypothetical protein